MVDAFRDYTDLWEDYYTEREEFREIDDERVLVLDYARGRGKTSGIDLETISSKSADLWHMRAGKVVKIVVYFDRDRALADLGLAE